MAEECEATLSGQSALGSIEASLASLDASMAGWVSAVQSGPAACLSWPFDLARAQHAASVQSGFSERSLLASADFERRLDLLERMTLGPFARRV